tara:strand:- start:27 stop:707 length:681 start_codon:yes stop_codon:yes gene_type:complete
MASKLSNEVVNTVANRQGIFGMGFSLNNNLDLLNLVILAIAGIVIKIFFAEPVSKDGYTGPATTNIWGYGLTAVALFLMLFMSLYLTKATNKSSNEESNASILFENESSFMNIIRYIFTNNSLPILLTLLVIIYIIYLNFTYFYRINQNDVTDSYSNYSFFSSLLLVVQIGIIIKYMFNLLDYKNGKNGENAQNKLIKSLSFLIITINFVFVMILHILLAFFSTDG